jgi:hypothetical protein
MRGDFPPCVSEGTREETGTAGAQIVSIIRKSKFANLLCESILLSTTHKEQNAARVAFRG